MKKNTTGLILAVVLGASAVTATACSKTSATWVYPDYENTVLAEGENSWDKWKEECPDGLTINWYSDVYIDINKQSVITKTIKEKTGITVNFDTQIGTGTDKLSVMIGSDTLPDVITLTRTDQRYYQLADQGYLFPINGLAEKWAPTMEIIQDIYYTSALANGNIYGLPSYYYATDMNETLQTNGGIMIRKDWFEAYMEYVIDNVPESEQAQWDITSPDGLIKAMKWIPENVLSKNQKNTYEGLVLDPFDTSKCNGNQGLAWLCQYWAVPYENEQGRYIDGIDTTQYLDMMKWLNECYREGLLTENALSCTTNAEVGRKIANGNAFVVCGSPQDYSSFLKTAYSDGIEYCSFVMKNYQGDDPVLGDIAGKGYTMSCITKNAKRPDMIIKLFDYLWSDEGQMLCGFGLEGKVNAKGEVTALADESLSDSFTKENATWYVNSNGEIKYTDAYLQLSSTKDENGNDLSPKILEENAALLESYGIGEWTMFNRPTFYNSLNRGKVEATRANAYVNNMKLPLTMYSTSYYITGGLINVLEDDYNDLKVIENKMNVNWSTVVLKMLQAKSSDAVETIFNNGRSKMTGLGHDKLYDRYADGYAKKKENANVEWGYPHNDPNYQSKTIRERYTWTNNGKTYTDIFGARGDVSYYKEYSIID